MVVVAHTVASGSVTNDYKASIVLHMSALSVYICVPCVCVCVCVCIITEVWEYDF